MSKVIFTDSVGHTFTMNRVRYTISDSFAMETSGVLKPGIKVEVTAEMKRSEINNTLAWSDKGAGVLQRNTAGTLLFDDNGKYMSIRDVYLVNLSESGETWREWGSVSVTFSNEQMTNMNSIITRFVGTGGSFDVYNANLSINVPTIRKNIKTHHMYNGSFYQNTGYDVTRVTLSGVIPWDSCDFPEAIVSSMECFKEENDGLVPIEQDLSAFLPDLMGFDLHHMFIENATATWNIEKKIVSINVNFLGPHQDIDAKSGSNSGS